MIDLLHQFLIQKWFQWTIAGIDVSFTNASFFMLLSVGLAVMLFDRSNHKRHLVPTRFRSLIEIVYKKLYQEVEGYLGKDTVAFFPYILCLFLFIACANVIGLLPFAFTTTSHIIVTGTLAMMVFFASIMIGITRHGAGFLKTFVPNDAPWYILPLIVPIEIMSFCARPISLSVRLFANMVSGHIVIKLFAAFTAILATSGFLSFLGVLPLVMNVAFYGFELFVACLQAYIFTVLTCVYIQSAIDLH
jgi:F-type H+-transporting ATPase subunit a